MGRALKGRLTLGAVIAVVPDRAADERCLEIDRLKPKPRYLFCKCDTIVSISVAGVSGASVTIAEVDLRSEELLDRVGGSILTFSMTNGEGTKSALITAGDVPGGSEDRCRVGFAALVSDVSLISSSSARKPASSLSSS